MKISKHKITIIGLGYVGLPLAIEFSKKFSVVGFDINKLRINELQSGFDRTREVSKDQFKKVKIYTDRTKSNGILFTNKIESIKDSNIYIVTVPTPINEFKSPDLNPLISASMMLGTILKKGDIVIYESTVYPGCTEEVCVPVLEKTSNLTYNKDFFCGYSPERINPGDKINTLVNIKKVTSGSTPIIADLVDEIYNKIIIAGTHKAPSIKVAEASKAIENAQRDINISFMNELALIFDRIGIDTTDVIEAASTKWNFLKYKPGLVGGHCIGVDPYYLAHKAQSLGYHPEVILSGRRVNDDMGLFVSNKLIKLMIQKGIKVSGAKVLILGFTFKENCPDTRNSKVIDIYKELVQFGINVNIFDPHANANEVNKEYGIRLIEKKHLVVYDAILLAVSHSEFLKLNILKLKKNEKTVIFDIKSFLPRNIIDGRL